MFTRKAFLRGNWLTDRFATPGFISSSKICFRKFLSNFKEKKAQGITSTVLTNTLYSGFVCGGGGVNPGFHTSLGQELSTLWLLSCSHLAGMKTIRSDICIGPFGSKTREVIIFKKQISIGI